MQSEQENRTYTVDWIRLWKTLFIRYSGALTIVFLIIGAVKIASSGITRAHILGHLPLVIATIIFGVVCSSVLSFLAAFVGRFGTIKISDGTITGMNYSGGKNTIPLSDLQALDFSRGRNGINAIVVKSNNHGKIYISDHTEDLDALIRFLSNYASPVWLN